MRLNSSPSMRRAAGFTLVELLVTLVIVSVGILGIVKMEAAGVSESQVSRVRSLMTFQAESLAGAMRANRGYWSTKAATAPSFTLVATGQTYVPGANTTDATCTGTVCTSQQMAYADLLLWRNNFVISFPNAAATITCAAACITGTTGPPSYDITLTWNEKSVAVNRSSVGSGTTLPVSMVLHVQP